MNAKYYTGLHIKRRAEEFSALFAKRKIPDVLKFFINFNRRFDASIDILTCIKLTLGEISMRQNVYRLAIC